MQIDLTEILLEAKAGYWMPEFLFAGFVIRGKSPGHMAGKNSLENLEEHQ